MHLSLSLRLYLSLSPSVCCCIYLSSRSIQIIFFSPDLTLSKDAYCIQVVILIKKLLFIVAVNTLCLLNIGFLVSTRSLAPKP